jgi:hypothetical protein
LNIRKCAFLQDRLEYYGHILTKDGVLQSSDKTVAILKASAPTNIIQQRSILGLINFYPNYLPNVSAVFNPLNQLLKRIRNGTGTKHVNKHMHKPST